MNCPWPCTTLNGAMMSNIDYFNRFITKGDGDLKPNFEVWSYTRVSSKEQFEKNSSVDRQMEASRKYAELHNFKIMEEFGGTYESAKSDFTRKEFKRLIDRVMASRKKPYAVLVYKMSRFSRSGGNAIGLVNYLVEDLGVHLIEVCSGITTTTERGKAAIYESLFHAYKENLEKKEIVIPAMQAYLRNGNVFGRGAAGYDHYGPKVRNEKFLALQQRLVINKDGESLKEAWKWKASGLHSDTQILGKLAARGLHLTSQRISEIWRNPFYCGIIVNKMLDAPVKGNWEPLVSLEDFIKVQNLLDGVHPGNHSGYTHNKEVEPRPLTRLLKCDGCKRHMVGYRNKKKDLHYYKCLHCKGVSLNAMTTKKALRKGANELFVDFLDNYRLPDGIAPLVKLQLTKLFNHFNENRSMTDGSLKSQLAALEKKMKDLKIRHGLGDIDKETYTLTTEHLNNQIQAIDKELKNAVPEISNLDNLLSQAVEKLDKLSLVWTSSNLENKRHIQKTLFPDGIYYDVKKHEYLTTKTNEFISLAKGITTSYEEKENGNFQDFIESSRLVPRTGIEPALPFDNKILSLARLPIPPSGQALKCASKSGRNITYLSYLVQKLLQTI